MSKMSLHDPFGYSKHKLWPKEGSGVKLSIWLPSTNSQESPQFTHVQVACHISLESSRQRLQCLFRLHLNWRFEKEIMGLQSHGSLNFGNFGIPKLGVPGQNDIWVLALWPSTKEERRQQPHHNINQSSQNTKGAKNATQWQRHPPQKYSNGTI